jgi:monoamine oxidase
LYFFTFGIFNGEPLRKVYRPVNDMIYFAGEHTSLDAAATMEGAVQSGNQVARLIHHKLSTIEESVINH